MKPFRKLPLAVASLAVASLALAACQTPQRTTAGTKSGMTTVCRECYEAVAEAHRTHPDSGASRDEIVRTYQCTCCKAEMSTYRQNGTMMVKCGGCAREGVAWDKCLPPNDAAK